MKYNPATKCFEKEPGEGKKCQGSKRKGAPVFIFVDSKGNEVDPKDMPEGKIYPVKHAGE